MEKEKLTVSFRTQYQRNFLKEMALDLSCKIEQVDFEKVEKNITFLTFWKDSMYITEFIYEIKHL